MNQIEDSRGFSLREIAGLLARRKWWISITFILIVSAVTFGTLRMPKQYESRMKVLVKNERADMIVSADRNGSAVYPGEVSETRINSEIELLNNNNLLQGVVVKCGLDRLEYFAGSTANEGSPVAIEKAMLRLQHDLKIFPVRKANVIQVEYTNRNPSLAAAVLGQLAELYLEAHLKAHSTPGTYEFFASQATRYHDELKGIASRLSAFRQQEGLVMFVQQKETTLQKTLAAESTLMQADAEIQDLTFKIADTRKRIGNTEQRILTQSRTIPNQNSVERMQTILVELQNRRTQLLVKFRSDDRVVMEIQQEIADTQAALERAIKLTAVEQTTAVNPLHQTLELDLSKAEGELAGMQARRRTLSEQARNYRQQLTKLENATAEYDDLVRAQKEAEVNYLLYAKKTEEARISESLDRQKISNVAISETPTVPHLPSKPNVQLNLAMGGLLALFLSLAVALGAEYFVNTVQQPAKLTVQQPAKLTTGQHAELTMEQPAELTVEQPAELEALTGLPVLAYSR